MITACMCTGATQQTNYTVCSGYITPIKAASRVDLEVAAEHTHIIISPRKVASMPDFELDVSNMLVMMSVCYNVES